MNKNKVIFHIDADSFFVSAEISLRPELEGKDICISYNKSNSIVSSLSYSAKKKGARVPMKMYEIRNLIPNIIVIKPNFSLYETVSKRIFTYLKNNYSKQVEIGSIDEWYLDLTVLSKKYKSKFELAKKIQNDIYKHFRINISIGISYNKFLAKMATDLNKPKGITNIEKKDIEKYIWPLKIEKYVGIGKKLSALLIDEGIKTIGDLAKINKEDIAFKKIFKNKIDYYINNANGIGDNKIDTSRNESNSIGAQITLISKNRNNLDEYYIVLKKLCSRVVKELNKRNIRAKGISLIVKNIEKKCFSISKNLETYTDDIDVFYENIIFLFNKLWNDETFIMLGVSLFNLETSYFANKNIFLFDENKCDKKNTIINIINQTNERIKSRNLKLLSETIKE